MNYNKLKLKAGLEIHQQLDTGKLFCNCPGLLRKDKPDFEIRRKLHAVAGETGKIDVAVQHEATLNKQFIYEGYDDTTCLIELDEEPPKPINQSALNETLKIALLMNCEIYPCAQVMRKTVIDGSNTSGFQRTVLIAHDGFIETSFGKIKIETIALEEDAARIISRNENSATYRLDRLGIPLVEVVTAPEMSTPKQIKEAALKIGEILRATKVKRGIGTIRQDVNISTKEHPRVEIKGFQDAKMMIKTIDTEIERQQSEEKKESTVRNSQPDGTTKFLRPIPGGARMYPETDLQLLKISREQINQAKKHLPKLRTEIKSELKKKGLTDELINLVLSSSETIEKFNTLMKVYDKDANLTAKMIALWPNEISKKLKKDVSDKLTESTLEKILNELNENKIEKNDIKPIMEKIAQGETFENIIKIEKISNDEVEEEIRKIIKSKPGLRPNAYMGMVMAKFKGKLNAQEAMEIINKVLE